MQKFIVFGLALSTVVMGCAAAAAQPDDQLCVRGRYMFGVSNVAAKRAEALQLLGRAAGRAMRAEKQSAHLLVAADASLPSVSARRAELEALTSQHPCLKLRALNRDRRRAAGARRRHAPVRRYSCECDRLVFADTVPNDPSYGSLWGMKGTYGVHAPEAWSTTQGSSSVVVGVVDTGIDYSHPDLSANMWQNSGEIAANGLDDDGNGYIDDVYGYDFANYDGDPFDDNNHGTHVAGTIGATGNNGVGVVGVNWNVRLMGLKFLEASGSGYTSDAVAAIQYAVAQKTRGVNIVVLNNSWGGGGYSYSLQNAISSANSAGIVFAAAAGNSSLNNDLSAAYPANYNVANVISVAALTSAGNLASFSNYGATKVALAAPGSGIYSTIPGSRYASYSGTSMATPHVAGAIALLKSAFPDASVAQLKAAILDSCTALASLTGKVATGGTLNVNAAVTALGEPVPTPTPTPTATPSPAPTATPTPEATMTPTPEPAPTAEPPATPEPTATPTPTPEPTATPTPVPAEYQVSGFVRQLNMRVPPSSAAFRIVATGMDGAQTQAAVDARTGAYALSLRAGRYLLTPVSTVNFASYPARYLAVVRNRNIRGYNFFVRLQRSTKGRGRGRGGSR